MIRVGSLFVLSALIMAGCATTVQMTPMEIQEMQTRQFEHDKQIVFNSVVSVFQDLGYVINQADLQTGIITAEGTAKTDSGLALFGVSKNEQSVANAFVEEIGDATRVRLNFVIRSRTSSASGQTGRDDQAVLDADVYRNAFEQIDQAIFVRS